MGHQEWLLGLRHHEWTVLNTALHHSTPHRTTSLQIAHSRRRWYHQNRTGSAMIPQLRRMIDCKGNPYKHNLAARLCCLTFTCTLKLYRYHNALSAKAKHQQAVEGSHQAPTLSSQYSKAKRCSLVFKLQPYVVTCHLSTLSRNKDKAKNSVERCSFRPKLSPRVSQNSSQKQSLTTSDISRVRLPLSSSQQVPLQFVVCTPLQ